MKKPELVVLHLAFWILVAFLSLIQILTIQDPSFMTEGVVRFGIATLFHALTFYLCYCFAAPLLRSSSRTLMIISALAVTVTMFSYALALSFPFLVRMFLGSVREVPVRHLFVSILSSQCFFVLFGTLFRFTMDWFRSYHHNQELEKQNIAHELALLRSQINPHFLFNILNNLHSYVYRDQEKTAFGIIKLSEIMRYMLYDANAEMVTLEKEIDYIQNYIALQKLRVKDPDYVQFRVEGDVMGRMIPPMLLITFVENAFKYCRGRINGKGIDIELKYSDKALFYKVVNGFSGEGFRVPDERGFGLKNIRRRLDLIYKDKYLLNIRAKGAQYSVELIIDNP